jgi:hypothetical protein
MDNQKKIEELLISIHKLILEAKNEEEFNLINDTNYYIKSEKINKIKEQISLKKTNTDIPKKNSVPKVNVIANNPIKNSNYSDKTDSLNSARNHEINWKKVNFSKCQNKKKDPKLGKEELVLNDFEKLFQDCLSEWIENNLSRIVKRESDRFAKKMIANRLK